MKKVALIRRSFRFDGGAEASLVVFLRAYSAAGAAVTLICEHWSGPRPPDLDIRCIPVKGSRAQKFLHFKERVENILIQEKFDVVQSHEFIRYASIIRLGDGLHSSWVKRMRAAKQSWLVDLYLRLSRFHRAKLKAEKQCLLDPSVQCVMVNSELVGREVVATYPAVLNKITLVRNVVDEAFFSEEVPIRLRSKVTGEVWLLFVGSGWDRKNVIACIEAMSQLPLHFSLWIIGYDKNESKYRAYCKKIGLESRVIFLGKQKVSKRTYAQFDGLILPSIYDPFPNVACEALVSGLPIFVSMATGASDYKGFAGVNVCDSESSLGKSLAELDYGLEKPDIEFFKGEFAMRNATEFVSAFLGYD